jgi:hypothetical protein
MRQATPAAQRLLSPHVTASDRVGQAPPESIEGLGMSAGRRPGPCSRSISRSGWESRRARAGGARPVLPGPSIPTRTRRGRIVALGNDPARLLTRRACGRLRARARRLGHPNHPGLVKHRERRLARVHVETDPADTVGHAGTSCVVGRVEAAIFDCEHHPPARGVPTTFDLRASRSSIPSNGVVR